MIKKLPLCVLFLFVANFLLGLPALGEERLLTDETGKKIKVPSSPKRIISLAPSITEILFALGLVDEIAGVTDFCDHPEGTLKKPKIGGFVNPSMERIVSLRPDLIAWIRDGNRKENIQALKDLGLPVYLIDPKGFDGVMRSIEKIGQAVGRSEGSKKIVREMRTKTERIAGLTASLPRPTVFFQIGNAPMITVGKGTLADDLIRLAGGKSISEDETVEYPAYGIETILKKAPEIIIISSMEAERNYPNLVKNWKNWKSVPAVARNAIHVIDSNLVDRPTPRIVEGLEALVRIIHPEVLGHKK